MTIPRLAPRPSWPTTITAPKPQLTHSDVEWAAAYHTLQRLYVDERWKLRRVMQYMEREHSFKATEQMYKKRFAKWNFLKNNKRSTTNLRPPRIRKGCKVEVKKTEVCRTENPVSMHTSPGFSHRDGLTLLLLSSVRTWSATFFESMQYRNTLQQLPASRLSISRAKNMNFAFKLVVDMLDRGHGDLAGRLARKAFLLAENFLTLEGPALVWNLLELMHSMVTLRQAQLFQMLLAHLSALADSQMPETHPLPAMLRGLRGLVKIMSARDLPSLIERVWILNAEILFENFDSRLFYLYCHILWDTCSIAVPTAILFRHFEEQHMRCFTAVTHQAEQLLGHTSSEEDKMFQLFLTPRMDASPPRELRMLRKNSIDALRDCGDAILSKGPSFTGNTNLLLRLLAGLTTANVIEMTSTESEFRIDAGPLACVIRTLVNLKTDNDGNEVGALLDIVESNRAIVALREYVEGETNPQVVREMWLLQDALVAAGNLREAQEVELDAFRRVGTYIQDIAVHSI
ncbi:hypothetical protein K504DRAFT_500540 [Pleomassaria siparia CBS 279.74]|uniref:Clr5 domain-containing protein n=1 Tax=Pleomassaria siparia CBS 279.74 TaxID=1314801 RepID=A0A6G1KGY9_9PLEO|nr:hypothetical protein K504DRAFT_500540 [Pleomassaria siparia CBS 279.74]